MIFYSYLTATYFRPGEARSAYPCFDEPHFRAKIKIFINRDRFHIALCSTPVNATEEAGFYLGTGLVRKLSANYIIMFLISSI